ncbi:ATP-binding domain-containing protein [Xanthomonas sp. WHRI 7065]|uniref:DEAD/DEAH box helicase n=1 Tax=Xanthomonas sp. WHRI 7065 TaxID=3161569 RepID=UPI0032E8EFF7
MALQIFPKDSALRGNANLRRLIQHLKEKQVELRLSDSIIFHSFPLFREDDKLLVADVVVVSPSLGVLLISAPSQIDSTTTDKLEGTFSQVFSRLVRYPRLRLGRAQLKFNIDAFLWIEEGEQAENTVIGFAGLDTKFQSHFTNEEISPEVLDELISVIDGSKALLKPKERRTEGFGRHSRIADIARLEEEIRRFDRDQRVAYMSEIAGLQRIQGLAGSGKTVVLALKAALTAIKEPEANIVVTFYTKSLYQHIKQLITRFYRMHEDRDPNWDRIQVLHAWGGATNDGFYYQVARRFGHDALNFAQAKAISDRPFAAACSRLLADSSIGNVYDYVFVDEAQDFPPEFMSLALRVTSEEKLVIAYDVFQTIFDVEIPTAAILFGMDASGQSVVEFDEEAVLHKCYRNPREILLCAHAIGFGIYGQKIVQMLESKEHWEDFGYEIRGELTFGQQVVIERPQENSPSSISETNSIDEIISCSSFNDLTQEVNFVTERIRGDIQEQGISPEDILVITADDRNANVYLRAISSSLAAIGIRVNNIHGSGFEIRDFQRPGEVTLSTIYKAKGNEAYSVYLVGIDALFLRPTPRSRNLAFTGMTRAKGWLYVTGMGAAALSFSRELDAAKANFPNHKFAYPTKEELVFMKRDLVSVEPSVVEAEIDSLGDGLDTEDFERILRKKLKELQVERKTKKRLS